MYGYSKYFIKRSFRNAIGIALLVLLGIGSGYSKDASPWIIVLLCVAFSTWMLFAVVFQKKLHAKLMRSPEIENAIEGDGGLKGMKMIYTALRIALILGLVLTFNHVRYINYIFVLLVPAYIIFYYLNFKLIRNFVEN